MSTTIESESAPGKEAREFKMHPKLLLDVIRRQSGSLHKCVLEAVQNSIEAGATKIEVTLRPKELLIVDDGRGFTSKKEVLYCFEIFGAPHLAEEEKTFAQFRMGRGQLFSFGVNSWRSGTFQMDVDIEKFVAEGGNLTDSHKSAGIGYHLTEGLPEARGCSIRIKLYDELSPATLTYTIKDIERYVKYCAIPVIVNGRRVSTAPETVKWDFETGEGYIKLSGAERGVDIYNLGVFVTTEYRLGVSGVVVSKKRLDVNFARNEIITTCPVWKNLRKLIKTNTSVGLLRKKKLNAEERTHIIGGFLSGEYAGSDISHCCLFPDVSGRYWSARELQRKSDKPWTFAEEGSRAGDRVMQLELGVVFDEKLLSMWDYEGDPKDFFEYLRSFHNYSGIFTGLGPGSYSSLDDMLGCISDRHLLLPEKEWSKRETLIAKEAGWGLYSLICRIFSNSGGHRRMRVVIGLSDLSDAWTDGSTFVCINRHYIAQMKPTIGDFIKFAFLLLHEALHESSDTDNHVHTPEFFQSYHDWTDVAIDIGSSIFQSYSTAVNKKEKKGEQLEGTVVEPPPLQTA